MIRLPILPKKGCTDGTGARKGECSSARPLPANYMSDYSVLGLAVDRFDEALQALAENGYALCREGPDTEVFLDGPGAVTDVVRLLAAHSISGEISDVAGDLYQG
jgi:hypothetical protein